MYFKEEEIIRFLLAFLFICSLYAETINDDLATSVYKFQKEENNIKSCEEPKPIITKCKKKIEDITNRAKELKKSYNELFDKLGKLERIVATLNNGSGIGLNLDLMAVAATGAYAEIVQIDNKVAIYCTQPIGGAADLGVSISALKIQTFGCKTPEDYTGGFITFSPGIAIDPFMADLAISFGINNKQWKKDMAPIIKKKEFGTLLAKLSSLSFSTFTGAPGIIMGIEAIKQLFKINNINMQLTAGQKLDNSQYQENKKFANELVAKKDLSNLFNVSNIGILNSYFSPSEITILKDIFKITKNNLTGCNSFSLGGGLALSLLPVTVEALSSNYIKLIEFDLDFLKDFAKNPINVLKDLDKYINVKPSPNEDICLVNGDSILDKLSNLYNLLNLKSRCQAKIRGL